jgi:hypothetical protein
MAFNGGRHPHSSGTRCAVHDVVHKVNGIAWAGVSDTRLAVIGLHDSFLGEAAWVCKLRTGARTQQRNRFISLLNYM